MYGPRDVALNPAAPADIVSAAELMANVPELSDCGALVSSFVTAVTVAVEGYINQLVTPRTVTETLFPEDPFTNLVLRHPPSAAITSLTFKSEAQTLANFDTLLQTGTVRHVDGTPFPNGKIVVTYSAGMASVPPALKLAAYEFARQLNAARQLTAGVKRESVPDVADVTYSENALGEDVGPTGVRVPGTVAAILAPYVCRWTP